MTKKDESLKQKKKIIPKFISIILIFTWLLVIFTLSGMNSNESNSKSKSTLNVLIQETLNLTNKAGITDKHPTQAKKDKVIEDINLPMRKFAHATVFIILAILIMICLRTFELELMPSFIITVLVSFMYALFDEYHQTFISGRTGQVSDSLIDTLGALVGAILVVLIIKLHIKHQEKKKEKPKKVFFVSSIGGHLTQLLQIKSIFEDYDYLLITEKSDVTIDLKNKYHVKYFIYCNKKNFLKYFIINVLNAFHSVFVFFRYRPDCIVTTGANTAVPLCYLGRIFGRKVIFIESFAKKEGKTLAGKLVYPVATTFIVQWESMLKYYPKAKYFGGIY